VCAVSHLLALLVGLDQDAVRATSELRWEPATVVLTLASAAWVKGPLLVALAWFTDLRERRLLPLIALAATVSLVVASVLSSALKELVDRSRPPQAIGLDALGSIPASSSFPSGHAMTAFAVAGAIALLAPRLRWPVLTLAALIGFSRVYLGVHFWTDVLAGSVLGLAIGVAVAAPLRSRCCRQAAPVAVPAAAAT
jgi:membrane-associated phospholipid phosphatase